MSASRFLVPMALSAVALTGCFQSGWYNVYGVHCSDGLPRPGCDFYSNGQQITSNQDPYHNGTQNQVEWHHWDYYDAYGVYRTYDGWGWESPDGIHYDQYGHALNGDDSRDTRDLIAQADAQETAMVQLAGRTFAAKYALSEATGIQIARTLNDWAVLGKQRARTAQDIADFTQRLYGISVAKASAALAFAKTGDTSQLESANADIATYWGTTPETSKKILKEWYQDQLSEYNVQ